jgi:1-deoxy-D-xylulose-5-phosphate synthase
MGGMGSAVLEFMADNKYAAQVVRIGIPDQYIHHGTPEQLYADCGFDKMGIIATIKKTVGFQANANTAKRQEKAG